MGKTTKNGLVSQKACLNGLACLKTGDLETLEFRPTQTLACQHHNIWLHQFSSILLPT